MRHGRLLLLLLTPVLLTGCAPVPGWLTGTPAEGTTTTAAKAGGPSWIVVSRGSATPSARATGRPSPTPSAPRGLVPRGTPGPTPTSPPTCSDPDVRAGAINGLSVTPGAGTAAARWTHGRGGNVVAYRLAAVPQTLVPGRQPALVWRTITPTRACTELSASVTGLARKAPYVLVLEVVLERGDLSGTTSTAIARSGIFHTT